MEDKSYFHLKSGSDIRGVAVRSANSEITLTDEAVNDITKAFLKKLSEQTGKSHLKIAVGNDVRISCDRIFSVIKKAVLNSGCDLVYCGLCSTPSMFLLLKSPDWNCDASIMITASHMPYDKNGLKFFTPEGGLSGNDIEEILALAEKGERLPRGFGKFEQKSYMDEYCKSLVDMVRKACGKAMPLIGRRIIVDAGNGAGGFFANKVLQRLGANTEASMYLEPDGQFPNHIPNPENKEAIDALAVAVVEARADLGIIFDTDVDRAGAVDSDGREINKSALIALTAATLLTERPGTIVTDSVTSDGLTEFIESFGGRHVRYKRGYKNVIDEAIRLNNEGEYCPLAMETSGHAAFLENYFLDDGAYLMCRLLVTLAKQSYSGETLSSIINAFPSPVEEDEVRISFNDKSLDYKKEGLRVIDEIKHFATCDKAVRLAPVNYEGARINFFRGDGNGWLLIRMSVHDPVMPINFESRERGGDRRMAKKLLYILEKYPFLDVSALRRFINEGNN